MQEIMKLTARRDNLKHEIAELNSKVRHTEDEIVAQLFDKKMVEFLSVNWTKLTRVTRGHGY